MAVAMSRPADGFGFMRMPHVEPFHTGLQILVVNLMQQMFGAPGLLKYVSYAARYRRVKPLSFFTCSSETT